MRSKRRQLDVNNPFEMMKQLAQIEKMMKSMKADLPKMTAVGSSGAGLVEVTINGDMQVQELHINPVIIEKDQKDMMEVLIQSAFNDAIQKIKANMEDAVKRSITQGVN